MAFKASTGQRTDAVKTVCAMLNRAGGWVLFGVDRGIITGQPVSAETLESLVRELGRIDPPAAVTPEVVELAPGKGVILVRVPRGSGPHRYDGRVYLRTGSTTAPLEKEDFDRLFDGRTHPAQEPQRARGYVPPIRVPYELTALQRAILTALANRGPASSVMLEARIGEGHSNFSIRNSLRQLEHLGLVEKTGSTRAARWRLTAQAIP
ncbi:MAG TPA: ATP-binding protein [Longimicrobium sp.]|nr:ATP-binding protein [Longimicrobium sp.]